MANSFLVAENTASVAATIVGQDANLAKLVSKDIASDFAKSQGSTVSVPVRGSVLASTKSIHDNSTALATDELTEQKVDVVLADHLYSSVPLSEGDLDLDIKNFTQQVLLPQATAVARNVEASVASTMTATPATSYTYDPAAPEKAFTFMRKTLRANGVPAEATLRAAVGADIYADLLDAEALDDNGKVRGFEVTESTRIASDEIIGFIPSAFTLVCRAPAVPDGAGYGASVTENDFSLRHIRTFDGTVAVDRSLVSAFVKVQAMPLPVDQEDGTVLLVDNGGAIRLDTTV